MLYVRVTFVQVTFVLMTFFHIGNLSAVTEPALTKLFGTEIFLDPQFFQTQSYFGPKINLDQNFCHHPEIKEGASIDPILLTVILKPLKFMITCKKSGPYLQNSLRY